MTAPSTLATLDFALEGELTVCTITEWHQRLATALQSGAPAIAFDLAAVDEIDTAGIQWLAAIFLHAPQASRPASITACSPAVRQAVSFAHLTSIIPLPEALA